MKNMKKIISIFIVSLMLLSTVAFASGGETYYVSPNGSDSSGDGSETNPFATLERAKKEVAGQAGSTVIFLGGKYRLTEKVTFTSEDSGTADAPITYKAQEGAEVVFTGAFPLNTKLFTKVEDVETLLKLPESSRSKVYKLDLTKQGLRTVSEGYPVLYVNDSQATVARYPNEGYAVTTNSSETKTFDTEYSNVANWSDDSLKDAVFYGSIKDGFNWNKTTINSVSGTQITLANTTRAKAYYYVRNLIEELDAPGEYIVRDNILYYYPTTSDFEELNMEIVTFSDDTIIELRKAEYIHFDGITFEKAISSAINTSKNYTKGIVIKNCEFKYLMKEVLNVRGYDHIISDNYAYGCGYRFIDFQGGAKNDLTPGNILITRNRIVGCGYWNPAATTGVIKGGIDSTEDHVICIGNEVSHNIIQDCYSSSAINVTGNNNKILYNEIINMGRIIEDGGAIYLGKSAIKYGTEIAHNYIHDFNLKNDYCALYPDDGISGITMQYNVVSKVSKAMVSGVGANNNFSDNLFIDVTSGMALGTRMTANRDYFMGEGHFYTEAHDIFYTFDEAGERVPNTVTADAYFAQYPEIKEAVDNHINSRYPFFAPWNTIVTGNVSITDKSIATISSKPSHRLNTSNGDYTVTGEDVLDENDMIEILSGTSNTVDEIATYGNKDKNDAGVNATEAGNPNLNHGSVSFRNETEQDYTLTSGAIANSNVHKIDMTEIGILDTTNDKIFDKKDTKVNILDVSYDTKQATIAWEPVENASEYKIVITKDGINYKTETCYNIFHTNKFTFDLGGPGTYNVNVTAFGLSREDMFNVTGETSFIVNEKYTDNLKNALEILDDKIKASENGYEISNIEELKAAYATNSEILKSNYQQEINNAEIAVYNVLSSTVVTTDPEVTRIEPDQSSTMVHVEAIGFPANSLATVVVTNPGVEIANVATNASTETIRFIATVPTDALGRLNVSFDTQRNEIDYTGDYKIRITATDVSFEKTYTYGTVELSDVTFKSGNTVIADKAALADFAGSTVTLSMKVNNRLSRKLKPEAYLGIYEGTALKNAFVQNQTEITANSEGTIEITVALPSDYNKDSDLNLFMWDGGEGSKLLRPLTKTRFVFENN